MARPKWQQELEIFSRIHTLLVLTENIHDTYPVYEENRIVDTRECLEEYIEVQMKNDGYQNIVGFESKTQNLIQINDCPLRGVA